MASTKKNDSIAPQKTEQDFPIIGIGASAGGLDAFKRFLKAIPIDSGMAYVLVQHLDPTHESILPEILSKTTKIPVFEITDDIHLAPDNIYVIPENKMLISTDGVLKLTPRNNIKINGAIDVFFTTLAEVHQNLAVGIVLSGTGTDGTEGLKAIKAHGGITFAQDQESAGYDYMPKNAIDADVVDFILPPEEIPEKLLQMMHTYSGYKNIDKNSPKDDDDVFNQIILVLRQSSGVDFTYYKQTTVRRRIARRMVISGKAKLTAYLKFLEKNTEEQDSLFNDMLIPVTSFFRDPKVFQTITENVFPAILKNKPSPEPVRIWVAACSTGEEVYSLAIILHQFLEKISGRQIQIFASDISESAIAKARMGCYNNGDLKNIPGSVLKNYFTKNSDGYQVNKQIRDMCVFAVHNFLKDPPFAKMDLISCRNVLIYMDTFLQKRALSTFHYALKENGFLVLGKAETTGPAVELFSAYAKDDKIYARKLVPNRFMYYNTDGKDLQLTEKVKKTAKPEVLQNDFRKTAEALLLSKYTPASVIVNDQMDVVHINGIITPFLEAPQGKPTFNLLKMAREGLAFELRNTLHKAKTTNASAQKDGILVKSGGEIMQITVEVVPLANSIEPHFLVLFHRTALAEKKIAIKGKSSSEKTINKEAHQRIEQLEKELTLTREDMRAITEDQETANEELQSANEELHSSSEEMQSLNEELETSKEELQSTNEELIIVNQEMLDKQDQINATRQYSEAIIATVRDPFVVLDKNLRIKSINKSFYKKFNIAEQEAEGQLIYEIHNSLFDNTQLRSLLEEILPKKTEINEYEILINLPHVGECTLLLNARHVNNEKNKEQLILLAMKDITERKKLETNLAKTLKEITDYKFALDEFAIVGITDQKGIIKYANDNFCKISKYSREELIGQDHRIINSGFHPKSFFADKWKIISEGKIWRGEIRNKAKDGTIYWVHTIIVPFLDERGKPYQFVSARIDITDQKRIAGELTEAKIFAESATEIAKEAQSRAESATLIAENATNSKQQFLSNMSHEIRTPMNAIIGFTKVVLKTEISVKQREYLEAIKTSGDSLIVLINDILDLAKVDAGKMVFVKTPFKMAASISAMLHLFETKIQEKNLELVKEYDKTIPEILLGDSVRLHQIILNLLSNAIKFTSKGKITVDVRMLSEDAKKVTIQFKVKDSGIGIAENKLVSIFEKFHQATSETSSLYGGTGLGLAIVKQLVEAQGGIISVKSKIGEGTTFSITLDFLKTNDKARFESEALKLDPKIKNIHVLVVEDISLNQLLMRTLLDDFGFKSDFAGNGKIAIKKLHNKMYDIVLMDLQMPEMNGFEATQYIRKTMNSKIPIIALTADVTTVDLEKCKAVGMDDYLSKPVDEHLLYSKIAKLVKKPLQEKHIEQKNEEENKNKEVKYTNLNRLHDLTKSKPKLMLELISAYLEQTPTLIKTINGSLKHKDWWALQAAAHKIISSFSIVGIDVKYEDMSKKIQEYASTEKHLDKLPELVSQLEIVCMEACKELEEEFNTIKGMGM